MAGTISENYLSRPFTLGKQAGRELVYDVWDTENEEDVRTLLVATAPAVYLGRELDSIDAEPLGGGVWKGHARYVRFEDDSEFTFDTSGGTTKVTQSLATVNRYAPGGETAPDFQGAIGVSEDRVEGVDITTPTYSFTETHKFPDASVNLAYKLVIFNLTGKTNNAPFKGFATGEVLFMGASGSKRGDEKWGITYRFASSPNLTGQTVGTITGIAKAGWDYLWVRYADFADTFAFALVKRPISANVERVYESGDFSTLNIGT